MIVRYCSEIVDETLNGKIYLGKKSGSTNNEEKKRYGLAQSNAFDGFLYRTLRWNRLFDTGGDIVIINC